jgi:hypothetical protein
VPPSAQGYTSPTDQNYSFSREVLRLLWSWFAMEGWAHKNKAQLTGSVPMRRERSHRVKMKQQGFSYTTGGMCGRRETNEFLMQCSITNFKWQLQRKKKSFSVPQPSICADRLCLGRALF